MGIPEENTIILVDPTREQLEEIHQLIGKRISVLSSLLKDVTGILGGGILIGGIPWEVLRPFAM